VAAYDGEAYGRLVKWTDFRAVLAYEAFGYAKAVVDTANAINLRGCGPNDTACVLRKLRSNYNDYGTPDNPRSLGVYIAQAMPAGLVNDLIKSHISPFKMICVGRDHGIDYYNEWGWDVVYKQALEKTWCEKWKDQLKWDQDQVKDYLDDYPSRRQLYDTLYRAYPQYFRTLATPNKMVPRIRWLVERHFSLDSIKQWTENMNAPAYTETMNRLVAPRYSLVFDTLQYTQARPDTHKYCLERGRRQYELTNHTGNVLATITDRKIPHDINSDTLVDYYTADIITADDYYPFGMPMPGRSWRADSGDLYQFGFQGMLKDNRWQGNGNLYNTPFRQYDPRLGRWLSPDPIKYPWQGSYTAFNNNPIYFVDPLGLEGEENGDDQQEARTLRTVEVTGKRREFIQEHRQLVRMFEWNISQAFKSIIPNPFQSIIWGNSKIDRTDNPKADPKGNTTNLDFGESGEARRVFDVLTLGMPSGRFGTRGRPKASQEVFGKSQKERGATALNKATEAALEGNTIESASKWDAIYKGKIGAKTYKLFIPSKGPAVYEITANDSNRWHSVGGRFTIQKEEKSEMFQNADLKRIK
jgi:RHS repeat-associated protein